MVVPVTHQADKSAGVVWNPYHAEDEITQLQKSQQLVRRLSSIFCRMINILSSLNSVWVTWRIKSSGQILGNNGNKDQRIYIYVLHDGKESQCYNAIIIPGYLWLLQQIIHDGFVAILCGMGSLHDLQSSIDFNFMYYSERFDNFPSIFCWKPEHTSRGTQ